MDLKLKGQTVVITGASKGIGSACAESFAREGANIVITGRDAARLDEAVAKLRKSGAAGVKAFTGDLGLPSDREKLFAAHGDADILVNNAGAIPQGSLFDLTLERWNEVWQLKVFGYIHLTQLYLAKMKERRKGVIVNIIGMAGQEPRWNYICGSTGNAALIAFTRAAGAASPDWNVRVVGINPSATRTDRSESRLRQVAKDKFGDAERWQEGVSNLPFGRMAEASEIADLAAILASPVSGYLSGVVIDADGGQSNK
jgi:NAD(P)-dependent dehydrogenase (short-subunit alcohol dehydrogenase family)